MDAKAEEPWERNGRSVHRKLDEPAFILTVESEAVALEKLLNALQQQLADKRVVPGLLSPHATEVLTAIGKASGNITPAADYIFTLEQQLADLQAERDRYREAQGETARELNNIRENRCTCPHDYFHGDHHYKFCPAADESKKASAHLTFLLNRVAYALETPTRALSPSPIAPEEAQG